MHKKEAEQEEMLQNEEPVTEQENEEIPESAATEPDAGNTAAAETVTESQSTLEQQLAEYKDRLLRSMAEFDNFRKRTTKEKEQAFGRGVSFAVEAILPVVDNFERALATAADKDDSFVKGIELTYQQLMNALKSIGIEPMDAKGQPFDPHFHNAMMHVDDETLEENIVVEVFQTGYMYNETVLRPALVKVAN